MKFSMIIQLPFLHGHPDHTGQAIFPGHAEECPPHMWQPDCYPCTPDEARLLLKSFRELSLEDVEQMRHGISSATAYADRSLAMEMATLANFRHENEERDTLAIARRQAQKNLLWQWHMEELVEELRSLAAKCRLAEERLNFNFGELAVSSLEGSAGEDNDFPGVPWETTLVNAAYFLPCDAAIRPVGPMAEAVFERLEFVESEEHGLVAGGPIYRALGYGGHWLDNLKDRSAEEIFGQDRIWLYPEKGD